MMYLVQFVILGVLVSVASGFKTCNGTKYRKAGCYQTDEMDDMEQLISFRDGSGEQLDWFNMRQSVHSMLCQCNDAATAKGYEYFSIRFWAECWAGKKIPNYRLRTETNECFNPKFTQCIHTDKECVGIYGTEAVYLADCGDSWESCDYSKCGGSNSNRHMCHIERKSDGSYEFERVYYKERCPKLPCHVPTPTTSSTNEYSTSEHVIVDHSMFVEWRPSDIIDWHRPSPSSSREEYTVESTPPIIRESIIIEPMPDLWSDYWAPPSSSETHRDRTAITESIIIEPMPDLWSDYWILPSSSETHQQSTGRPDHWGDYDVTHWSSWGSCSKQCGEGYKERRGSCPPGGIRMDMDMSCKHTMGMKRRKRSLKNVHPRQKRGIACDKNNQVVECQPCTGHVC